MTTVLVNGVGGLLGVAIARRLSEHETNSVIGLGRRPPPGPIGRAEYLVAGLSGRQLIELLRAERVETVVHVDFLGADQPTESREAAVQQNVLGTMELLGACAAAGVRSVVLRSHAGVYGAAPTNPTMIGESRPVARAGLSGLVRDFAEVEQFVADFAPQHPALKIATMRCAPLVGTWSPLVGYLSEAGPRTLFGFDPIIQLLHLDDAAAAFAAAATAEAAGAFNLACDDTLRLSQAIRLAGQQPVPVLEPLVGLASALGDHRLLAGWPYDISFLRYSCVVDSARARAELGWSPAHSAADSLRAMRANGHALEDQAAAEAALRAFLARRS
jgi:UDP-glucose 4-epimerase